VQILGVRVQGPSRDTIAAGLGILERLRNSRLCLTA
jgi:hypothetical protein